MRKNKIPFIFLKLHPFITSGHREGGGVQEEILTANTKKKIASYK